MAAIKILNEHIKTGNFHKIYLLYGEEKYLLRHYEKKLVDAAAGNHGADLFFGKGHTADDIINAAESLPFLSDRRVLHIKGSGLFTTGRKNDSEKIAGYLQDMPGTTTIIFVEGEIDKRGRLYKIVKETGVEAELKRPPESGLIKWLQSALKQSGIEVSASVASFFIRYTGGDMDMMHSEAQKIISYKNGGGKLTNNDIEEICTKSLQTKIFDLVAAIGNKDTETALTIFSNLLLMKEPPVMVLTMIARQFRIMFECLHLSNMKLSAKEVSDKIGQRGFIVRECLEQSNNFTEGVLLEALNECLETDISIKTGKISDKLAVEILIIKYCAESKAVY